ncbi:synaptic vesicle glycoprotein 2A-like isoform X1 [Danaus plexippus]|uniref:synaptic vesicle glycoprotein 2A-like isoform X1 n=1 Tax=Danaus plexippus TaxID=13037 RepID=UPI002AB2BB65|nr:synaptic vesicle glycoprotein 2A-like isoform X1 [Danaus plexippus]
MSDLNLQVLAGHGNVETKAPTAMQEVNLALKACGFGLFHIQLMFTSFVGFVAGIMVTNSTPYILPIAECDLNMNLLQKGVLNAMPFVGMVSVCVVAGFLTDTFGRKIFLVGGYGGLFVFTFIGGISQTYLVLVTAKLFEGMLFAASFNAVVTLTSEFCHNGIRDRMMLLQSSFAGFGQVIGALMSWAILTQKWRDSYFNGTIVLNTWNFYLIIMSMWSLLASCLYMLLPESPKYFITQKRYDEARKILINIYTRNTGKTADSFPYPNLWKDKMKLVDESPELSNQKFGSMLTVGLHNIKPMFRRPLGLYLILFSFMMFFSMILYNVIRLWFPQLSTIAEYYSTPENQNLCVMLDAYTSDLRSRNFNTTKSDVCIPAVSGTETYLNSVILGSICVVPFIISGILVSRVGKKYLYIVCGLITVGATLGLRWASSKIEMVALFSTDVAIAQTMNSLNQALVLEHFPTTTRSLAIAVLMTCGRIGSLVGNILFPILLDKGCVVPFYTLAGSMICITSLSFVLPVKKK